MSKGFSGRERTTSENLGSGSKTSSLFLYWVCIVESPKSKLPRTTEALRGPLVAQLPAPPGSPGSLPGPACRARHPRAVAMAPRRPAPPPARSRARPSPARRCCGGGGGAGAGGDAGERKSAARRPRPIGCFVLGPGAPPLWRGHVIPFKDGRPVVLMNNTWWGEGVRVGVEG